MSSMNRFGEAPASSKNTTLDPVKRPAATYNLDDFALPNFALKTLELTNVPPDVRTWRELADYVRANLRILPPLMLERTLKLQADYSSAGPAERTSIPAMTPTIKHATVRASKGRVGPTLRGAVNVTPTKTNRNVPGAAQSQGLAQIAIGPRECPPDPWRKEAIPANVSVEPRVTREPQLQAPRKEAIAARVSAVPGLSRENPTQVSRKGATPAKINAPPGSSRALPQATRKEAIPAWGATPGAHREYPSQGWRKEATPANWSAAPSAHREHPLQVSRKEAIAVELSAAPGTYRENPSQVSRKEAIPVNFSATPSAHREHPSQVLRKEAIQTNWSAAPGGHGENLPQVSSIPVDWSAARGAHREISSQASLQEAVQMNWSASSGPPRQLPSEPSHKETIPSKEGVVPAILMSGSSKQKAISTATEATFGQAKSAMANRAKAVPQGLQKLATRDTEKGDQSLKSVSVNLNTNERAKSLKYASKGHEIGKIEAELEETVLTPMGELIDLSIPISARSAPQPFHPLTHGVRHLNSCTKASENTPLIPALAAIPALIPAKQSDAQPLRSAKGPMPLWPQPASQGSYLRVPSRAVLPPAAPPTLSRHSSSTRSQSPSEYSRSPSPEKCKAAEPTGPKQAGRYYLVHKDGGYDYVWVAGAQRGDPCPPHLVPVE